VGVSCHACSAELRDGARFCDACGSATVAVDTHAEYKQVTVLFADVVHSMEIAAAVGAERLREIMAEVFQRSSMIVKRYGGTVDKFTGDGIMAVFGAPIALEDHALRACRAALDIQNDAQGLTAEVKDRDHVALQLRVGLNSGEAITGEIGSGPLAYTAVGEQVGMAQRMESVAPPGGVMVSESTARLPLARDFHRPAIWPLRANIRRSPVGDGGSKWAARPSSERARKCRWRRRRTWYRQESDYA
jgi:adenylate cyclase